MPHSAIAVISSVVGVSFLTPVLAGSMIQIPGGTYQETCQNIRVDGYQLRADCKRLHSGVKSTSIDLRGCQGEIENWDGRLSCVGKGSHGEALSEIPNGTYRETCMNIMTSNGLLKARCRAINGAWKNSTIRLDRCRKYGNKNGALVCE